MQVREDAQAPQGVTLLTPTEASPGVSETTQMLNRSGKLKPPVATQAGEASRALTLGTQSWPRFIYGANEVACYAADLHI